MTIHGFVGLAFVINVIAGNICFVGTIYTAEAAEGPQQELLSREIPMSMNVVTCAWEKTDEGWKPTPHSPCASGHCIKKQAPEPPCLHQPSTEHVTASFPVSFSTYHVGGTNHPSHLSFSVERPPPLALASVVLRI